MKELRFETLIAVFEEMFGRGLFWALVAAAALVTLAFVAMVLRERRLRAGWLLRAELLAPVGAIAAILFVQWITSSGFRDIGGAIDVVVLIGIGAFLMALAATDRQTAWAPDLLTFPLAGLAGAHAMLEVGGPAEAGLGLGIGLFFVIQVLYAGVSSRLTALPPPPDLLAFAIGPVLLGFGAHLALALIAISALLVIVRILPPSIAIFHRPEAMRKAAADLGYEGDMGPAVPLLAVMMPVYLIMLALLLVYPNFLM